MPLREAEAIPLKRPDLLTRTYLKLFTRDVILPVPFVEQKPYRNLCWAACGEMVFAFKGRSKVRCDFASWRSRGDCCVGGYEPRCDNTAWPHQVYAAPEFDLACKTASVAATERSIRAEIIDHKRPLQMYFAWNGGGGHTALIVGVLGNGLYRVLDPLWGPGSFSHDFLLHAYGKGGTWRKTWHGLGG